MNAIVCPHCQNQIADTANVCAGCGAEIVRGVDRRGRRLVGLACVVSAILLGVVILRVVEIAKGGSVLPAPKASDGLFVVAAILIFLVIPYLIGSRAARSIGRSRIRFYRTYRHQ